MKYTQSDFTDSDEVARAKGRSPHARQLCQGSSVQRMDVSNVKVVACPKCLKMFSQFVTQKNRDMVHPVVPSHLPDGAGASKVAAEDARRKSGADTVRPY